MINLNQRPLNPLISFLYYLSSSVVGVRLTTPKPVMPEVVYYSEIRGAGRLSGIPRLLWPSKRVVRSRIPLFRCGRRLLLGAAIAVGVSVFFSWLLHRARPTTSRARSPTAGRNDEVAQNIISAHIRSEEAQVGWSDKGSSRLPRRKVTRHTETIAARLLSFGGGHYC
jgi:hypothetical protein